MNHVHLIHSLYQIGAVRFGEFILKSGQKSSIYLNLRCIISYPSLLRIIANMMWQKVKDHPIDLVCGVPYTALPIATCISLEHHIPMVMRRKEKKDYGTKQSIEGIYQPNQHCLVIEDVITTGSSIIETANDLIANGLQVIGSVALVDREQGGKETLNQHHRVLTLFTLTDILQTLFASSLLSEDERGIVSQFLLKRTA